MIGAERRGAGDPRGRGAQHLQHPARQLRVEPVVDPLALAPVGDDAGLAQLGQMAGNLGLRDAQGMGQFADAELAFTLQ